MKVVAALGLMLALAFIAAQFAGCTVDHHFEIKRSQDSYRPGWCDTATATEKQKYPGQCL